MSTPITCSSLRRRRKFHVSKDERTSSISELFVFMGALQYCIELESEMYQLSHLLIEQRNILSTLREENAVNDTKEQVVENENGKLKTENLFVKG